MPTFNVGNASNMKPIVAYIDKGGDLCIRPSTSSCEPNGIIFILKEPLESHRPALEDTDIKWNPEDPDNKAVFREGDSVTITF